MPDKVCLSFCKNMIDHFCGSILVHCRISSWSHGHIGNKADAIFCFGCFSKGGLHQLFPQRSCSQSGVSGESLVSGDAGLISSSLSDNSRSLSLSNGVVSKAERRSFTWREVPLTNMDCSLMTPVTQPFLKLDMHRLLGSFTPTGFPILYGLCISLHTIDPFDSNLVAVDRIDRCTCNGYIVFWCCIISVHGVCNCTFLSGSDPFYTLMTPLCYAIATWHIAI